MEKWKKKNLDNSCDICAGNKKEHLYHLSFYMSFRKNGAITIAIISPQRNLQYLSRSELGKTQISVTPTP